MASRKIVLVVVCCVLLGIALADADPCGTYDTSMYVCRTGLEGNGHQLCPSNAPCTCYTPGAGADFGCGVAGTCGNGKPANCPASGGGSTGGSTTGAGQDPCGTYDTKMYVCRTGLEENGHQLCPADSPCTCYTPGAGAPFGCGKAGSCGNGKPANCPSTDTKSGSVTGDPFLEGFDGRTFEFTGAKDQVFNLITHADYQLNAAFIDAEMQHAGDGTNGTFIATLGLSHKDHQVQVQVLEDGALNVTVNGVSVNSAFGPVAFGEASAELDTFGSTLTVATPLCIYKIAGVAPYTFQGDYWKAHIDMQFEMLKDPVKMHGVLGQTMYNAQAWPDSDFEFHGEGVAADYRTEHLFSSDFKYNLFGKAGPLPVMLTRARMLLGIKRNSSAVNYPIFAGVSTYPRAS